MKSQVFRVHTRNWRVPPSRSVLEKLSAPDVSGGMTGADVEAVCKEANLIAVRRTFPLGALNSALKYDIFFLSLNHNWHMETCLILLA